MFPPKVYTDLGLIGVLAIMWLSRLHRYMFLFKQGIPMCAVRYEYLTADPEQIVTSIFHYCDLPVSEVPQACKEFDQDSQSGSLIARKSYRRSYLDKEDRLKIRELLQSDSDVQIPDFIVPGTLKCFSKT
jgi:hypothetical protein